MKVLAIALNTHREAVRNKILYSVVLFAAVLIGVSALFGSVTIGSQVKVIKDFGLFSLSFLGALITIIAGGSLLSRELKQRTVYNILSKPVSRAQFIVGKYLGLTLTVQVLIALMGLGLVGFLALMEGTVDLLLFQGIFLVLLEVAVVAAVSMFFSALVVTTTLSGLFTLAFYIAGRSITYFGYFLKESADTPTVVSRIVQIFDAILPDLSLFNHGDTLVYGHAVSAATAGTAAAYAFAYSVVALLLAVIIFERRELV